MGREQVMQGADTLVAMRRRHRVPAHGVLVEVTDGRLVRGDSEAERSGGLVALRVNPAESVDRLDLRCVVGLKVIVTDSYRSPQERMVRAVCAACVAAGAKRVVGVTRRMSTPIDEIPDDEWVFDYTKEAVWQG